MVTSANGIIEKPGGLQGVVASSTHAIGPLLSIGRTGPDQPISTVELHRALSGLSCCKGCR